MLQSSRRENLVRLHFGLFVQCAEGLEFLKAYRKGGKCLFYIKFEIKKWPACPKMSEMSVAVPRCCVTFADLFFYALFYDCFTTPVLKGNEMRNRRGSNARKSIASAEEMKNKSNRGNNANGGGDGKEKLLGMESFFLSFLVLFCLGTSCTKQWHLNYCVSACIIMIFNLIPTAISSADKGLERLRRSQTTLDAAKVEAQRTLAPILERMKQSRRIKSAEKVLKRMTAILGESNQNACAALFYAVFDDACDALGLDFKSHCTNNLYFLLN